MKKEDKIKKLHKKGLTQTQIANIYGLSKQRISQIILGYRSPLSKDWRNNGRDFLKQKVRKRDNYTCRHCGKKWRTGLRNFIVHHINGGPWRENLKYKNCKNMDEQITVCYRCHMDIHKIMRRISLLKSSTV
jgi:hypothetical protein